MTTVLGPKKGTQSMGPDYEVQREKEGLPKVRWYRWDYPKSPCHPVQGSCLYYSVKHRLVTLLHTLTPASDSVGPVWDLRMCISNRCQGAGAGSGATPCTTRTPLCPSLGTTREKAKMDGPSPAMPWAKRIPSGSQPKDLPEKPLPTPTRPKHARSCLYTAFPSPWLIIL